MAATSSLDPENPKRQILPNKTTPVDRGCAWSNLIVRSVLSPYRRTRKKKKKLYAYMVKALGAKTR